MIVILAHHIYNGIQPIRTGMVVILVHQWNSTDQTLNDSYTSPPYIQWNSTDTNWNDSYSSPPHVQWNSTDQTLNDSYTSPPYIQWNSTDQNWNASYTRPFDHTDEEQISTLIPGMDYEGTTVSQDQNTVTLDYLKTTPPTETSTAIDLDNSSASEQLSTNAGYGSISDTSTVKVGI